MNTKNEIQTVTGAFSFFTCKTGRGRDRYCVKVSGTITADDGKQYPVTVQAFDDWDGKLPANLSAVIGNTYTDPETGLHRSVKGSIEGTVKVPAGTPVTETAGSVVVFHRCDLPVDAFALKTTDRKFVEFR